MKEKADLQNEIIEKSIIYRGEILHECSVLEKDVEEFIIDYFFKKGAKGVEFSMIILDRIPFDSKISVFEIIAKKQYAEDYFKKHLVKLFSELRYVKDQRNIFAHYIVNVFDGVPPIKQGISFVNIRNSVSLENYDKGKYELLRRRITKCIEVIRTLLE